MGVGGVPRAPDDLLVAERVHHDGVLERALAAGVERPHVEDVDPLHLAQDLEALEARALLEVRGDGAGEGTGGEEVVGGFDGCIWRIKDVSWGNNVGLTVVIRGGGLGEVPSSGTTKVSGRPGRASTFLGVEEVGGAALFSESKEGNG